MTKKWEIVHKSKIKDQRSKIEEIVKLLLENRGLRSKKEIANFLNPPDPYSLTAKDVGIGTVQLKKVLARIEKAIKHKESVVVYADYDADGITAGAIMWETLFKLGAKVMPYIPHRVEEGYGFSKIGIDNVKQLYNPKLIISVDHGVTAKEKIVYAQSLGIEIIVTDHHVLPKEVPKCLLVHTTNLCGAGVAWFVAKELLKKRLASSVQRLESEQQKQELLALAAMGTIADLVPLKGANRAIVKHGLEALNKTNRVGLEALIQDAGLVKGILDTYTVSHMLAPRLNAMGRLEHALDALRLLCTNQKEKAIVFAQKLGITNRDRQQLTIDTTVHAMSLLPKTQKKLLFITHTEYNQGVIGLVAGKLVEKFYRPAIVIAQGEVISKASARSISGFNIIEAIRSCTELLVDAGGHPMAAGFTVETKNLKKLQQKLEEIAEKELTEELLTRVLKIDLEIPLESVSEILWKKIGEFAPFGMGNPEPVFATREVKVNDVRLIGRESKHLKLTLSSRAQRGDLNTSEIASSRSIDSRNDNKIIVAIAFGMGEYYAKLSPTHPIDIAYSIDMNQWNGNKKLQLKIKDIQSSSS